ncbi:hypothetical protein, variant [Cryptococcus amylolentus CBS 6039]|uniref:Uncharacterized protein n=1 Tax=Cryptococcus amylolentus CBS 6039 TaxID=1295533 RepID=A0A1E3HTF3_9TREE|nr:hypothetical protein L202_04481 [Cryptococcus amylolentus CBS 6039]XP_018994013.1 hypothetical protein, variant [Cryptococcus amylolentus CBS 6039]ODN78966.1 hypothetical protein L202_04481 [Cryptococcus amylolentus CBS 6039]ODN78967.1 hypothetical protein, variant [Cryptococcus amylolentus CBS 6039]
MMMTSSIITPHSRTITHTPSPNSSPKLVPVPSTIAPLSHLSLSTTHSSSTSPTAAPGALSQSAPTRSYVRGPQARPYGPSSIKKKELDADSRHFAELVARSVDDRRGSPSREKGLIEMVENVTIEEQEERTEARKIEQRKQLGRMQSLGGSWENERAELIVDYPVWSPGCFQDLSTLHTLRDKTLAHTHSLLSHLLNTHSTPTTYRLLARSATSPKPSSTRPSPFHHGWGCIRLAPSRAQVRRTSLVQAGRPTFSPRLSLPRLPLHATSAVDSSSDEESPANSPRVSARDYREIKLRTGFSSGSSDEEDEAEDEEESADVIVAKEIEKRGGGKEGTVFLMTLFGQPALILT